MALHSDSVVIRGQAEEAMPFTFEDEGDKLVFEFQNSIPIELGDLTRSLNSVANQYRRFVIRENLHEETEAKLYIREVRNGSAILELFAYIQSQQENINNALTEAKSVISTSKSVLAFGSYLKSALTNLRGGKQPEADLDPKDVNDLHHIVEPTAKDPGGQLVIHADRGATVQVTVNFNNSDANTIQNQSTKLLENMRETDQKVFKKRAFYWDTASKGEPRTTDKGVVETIERRPVPVIFDDKEIKEEMIAGKAHPFSTVYIVDVELLTVRGKTKAYKITHLHEIIEDDEEDG